MATRWQLTAVTLCMIFAAPPTIHADIFDRNTGKVIPGTEGIIPGPGVRLDHCYWWRSSCTRETGSNSSAMAVSPLTNSGYQASLTA